MKHSPKRYFTRMASPIDELILVSDGDFLVGLYMKTERHVEQHNTQWQRDDGLFKPVLQQLQEYFAGERKTFDLPHRGQGTAFQQKVWSQLLKIPYGSTQSYGELAQQIGQPKACRAVGMANGQNPISILVPCHRVIGANGKLTGYGGGLPRKQWLLAHEAAHAG